MSRPALPAARRLLQAHAQNRRALAYTLRELRALGLDPRRVRRASAGAEHVRLIRPRA